MIERVGQQLRKAREEKSLTLEQVSREIRIRKRFLEALEQGNLGVLPSAVQVRGFLRSYADFLGLNADELLTSLHQTQQSALAEISTPKVEEESHSPETLQQVQAIFEEIGSAIRRRRDTLGLSLEDIEQHTHISQHYARMIENGEFTSFPSPVQARGMITNYVNFLEMDANAVLLRYAEALQTRLAAFQAAQQPAKPQPKSRPFQIPPLPQWLRNILSPDVAIFGVLGIFIVFFTIWGIGRIINTQANISPQPTAPSLAGMLLPSPTPPPIPIATSPVTSTPQVIGVGDQPIEEETVIPTLLPISQAEVQIYIIIRQRTYLKVTVDGEVAFEGRALPGSNQPYTANQQIEILTGNAAALQVFYNDVDMGTLGILGEVINVIYTRDGVILPTIAPTPTIPPEELITPTPTLTPTVTPDISLLEQENTPLP